MRQHGSMSKSMGLHYFQFLFLGRILCTISRVAITPGQYYFCSNLNIKSKHCLYNLRKQAKKGIHLHPLIKLHCYLIKM